MAAIALIIGIVALFIVIRGSSAIRGVLVVIAVFAMFGGCAVLIGEIDTHSANSAPQVSSWEVCQNGTPLECVVGIFYLPSDQPSPVVQSALDEPDVEAFSGWFFLALGGLFISMFLVLWIEVRKTNPQYPGVNNGGGDTVYQDTGDWPEWDNVAFGGDIDEEWEQEDWQ